MSQMATITSKRQLTIPSQLFKKMGFKQGEKVIVTQEEDGSLKIKSAIQLVEELAGSIPVPTKWKGKNLDRIVKEARDAHFNKKYPIK